MSTIVEQEIVGLHIINEETLVLTVGVQGPPGSTQLSGLTDVSLAQVKEGSVLSYNANVKKFEATNEPNDLLVNGGYF